MSTMKQGNLCTLILILNVHLVRTQRSDSDQAVIVDAASDGSAQQTGPGPSLLGSMDNIFSAVKEFDQYQCLERMLCEYMQQSEGSEALPGDNLLNSFLGLNEEESHVQTLNFGNANRFAQPQISTFNRPVGQSGSFQTRPHFQPRPPTRGSFVPPPPPPPPSSLASRPSFSRPGGSFFRRRISHRARRSIQGNIIRLFQATGMDSSNMYPYIRAALIGHATRDDNDPSLTRGSTRRSTCSELYNRCPSDADSIVNYFNNHNGGLVNQVDPSVQQEVGPLVSAIINEAVVNDDNNNDNNDDNVSPAFASADTLITNMLVQGVANYFTGGSSNSNSNGILSSLTGSDSSNSFLSSITSLFSGKRR